MYKIILFCFFIGKCFLSTDPITEVNSVDDAMLAVDSGKPLPTEDTIKYFEEYRGIVKGGIKVDLYIMLSNYYYSRDDFLSLRSCVEEAEKNFSEYDKKYFYEELSPGLFARIILEKEKERERRRSKEEPSCLIM